MKRVFFLASLSGLLVLAGVLFFMKYNNDHVECEKKTEYTVDENGNSLVLKTHICREKYSF